MAFFRGISLHLWSANGLTAEWHDGHQGPYLRIQDEDGNTCRCTPCPSSSASRIGPSAWGSVSPWTSSRRHPAPR
jgi:hypothetical protein